MSEFWDSLSKTMNEMANKAIKFSGDAVELTKTSVNIKLDEIKRDGIFKEIGKMVYDGYKSTGESLGGVFAGEEIIDCCKYIDEIEKNIAEQIVRAAHIKNKKFCVSCGTMLDKCLKYCYECGSKQPEIVIEEEENCCCCCDCSGVDSTEATEAEENCSCDAECSSDGATSDENKTDEQEVSFDNFSV